MILKQIIQFVKLGVVWRALASSINEPYPTIDIMLSHEEICVNTSAVCELKSMFSQWSNFSNFFSRNCLPSEKLYKT